MLSTYIHVNFRKGSFVFVAFRKKIESNEIKITKLKFKEEEKDMYWQSLLVP